jgi:hypothetical protein
MKKYLATLAEDQPQRSSEEYLGAFTESLKLTQHENPIDRIGHAVLLAAKTALRLKAVMPQLKEHEISNRLQIIARSTRLMNILKDLTPEERSMFKWSDQERTVQAQGKKSPQAKFPRKPSSTGRHARKTRQQRPAK